MLSGFVCEAVSPLRACAVCAGAIVEDGGLRRGRKRVTCSDECRRVHRLPPRTGPRQRAPDAAGIPRLIDCAECGIAFIGRSKKTRYCTPCSVRVRTAARIATRRANVVAQRTRICLHCAATFVMRNPSGRARRGEANEGKYCSRACSSSSVRVHTTKRAAKAAHRARNRIRQGLAPLVESAICVECNTEFKPRNPFHVRCSDQCRQVRYEQKPIVERCCLECAATFTPPYRDKRTKFCSTACMRRAARRPRKAAERARLRSPKVESVNPIRVFVRDNWRCQLCGVKTPRSLRGTLSPKAPELDHILPLAKGGEHSYRNTHCACRKCNGAKSDRPLGQTLLFG